MAKIEKMNSKEAITRAIERLELWSKIWYQKVLKRDIVLPPPATEEAIRAREAILEFRFPPSYRLFLSHHNGWPELVDLDVFGVSGADFQKQVDQHRLDMENLEIFYKKYGGTKLKGKKLIAKLKRREKENDECTNLGEDIFLPHHVPLAVMADVGSPLSSIRPKYRNLRNYYYVFNRSRAAKEGEYPVSLAKHTDERNRYDSFGRFLEERVTELEGRLREAGFDPYEKP